MKYTHNYSHIVLGNREWIHVKTALISPCCRREMKFDHFRSRGYVSNYTKHDLMIEVHRCPKCGRQHSILPDFLVAYKRYSVESICKIVKTPYKEAETGASTKSRMMRWLGWFLVLVAERLEDFEQIGVAECTVEELAARLCAASGEGKWLFGEYEMSA